MSTLISVKGYAGEAPVSVNNPVHTAAASINLIDIIDVNANGNTYYGSAVAGSATSAAAWQIQRKSVSGVVTSFLWADSNVAFDNIWDNRTSLTYA